MWHPRRRRDPRPRGISTWHPRRRRDPLRKRSSPPSSAARRYDDVVDVPFLRLCLAEGLRLYPQPPLLIRRALDSDELPRPFANSPRVTPARGSDIFMSTWSLHKDPRLWDEPESFDPTRFERKREPGPDAPAGWRGFDPAKIPASALYPTEQAADYAYAAARTHFSENAFFRPSPPPQTIRTPAAASPRPASTEYPRRYLPFGAGNRRCVGDQFAVLEAAVVLTSILRHFDFEVALAEPESLAPKTGLGGLPVADVGMRTGATIHTEHGLWMRVLPREVGDG